MNKRCAALWIILAIVAGLSFALRDKLAYHTAQEPLSDPPITLFQIHTRLSKLEMKVEGVAIQVADIKESTDKIVPLPDAPIVIEVEE